MKTLKLLLCTFVFFNTMITFAQQTPQWILPIYFETGDGQKDTVYICYDPNATGFSDVIDEEFSQIEGFVECDLNEFNAYVESTSPPLDNYLRKGTVKNEISSYTIIGFVGTGVFPLKITWDNSKLYSSELPPNFIEIPERPRARIDIYPDCYCTDDCYYICTDSLYPEINSYMTFDCMDIFIDSVILLPESTQQLSGFANSMIKIRRFNTYDTWWTGSYYTSNGLTNIDIFPNPTANSINISGMPPEEIFLYLYDHSGKLVKEFVSQCETNFKIETSTLKSGIYFLKSISTEDKIISINKIIIL